MKIEPDNGFVFRNLGIKIFKKSISYLLSRKLIDFCKMSVNSNDTKNQIDEKIDESNVQIAYNQRLVMTKQVSQKQLKFSPGIDTTLLKLFRVKSGQNKIVRQSLFLYIEEFTLKRHLYYDIFRDEIIGVEDYGEHKLPTAATKVVLFSLQTIKHLDFHPIAYIFTGNNNAKEIRNIMFSILDLIPVLGVVTSLTPNFYRLIKLLKVTPRKPYFIYHCHSYQYLFDPMHLIRLLRNVLLKNDLKYGNKVMSWKYINDFGKLRNYRSTVPTKYIFLNSKTKRLTESAIKIFSSKFASSMYNVITRGIISSKARATVELLEFIEELCSLFMYNIGNWKMVLLQHLKFFDNLQVIDAKGHNVTKRFHSIKAWKITIKAAMNLNNDNKTYMRLGNLSPKNEFRTELQELCNKRKLTAVKFTKYFQKYVNQKTMGKYVITILNKFQSKRPFAFKNYSYRSVVLNENNPFKSLCGYLINQSITEHSCNLCWEFKQENDSLEYFIPSDSCHIRNIALEGFETPQEHFLHFVFKMETIFLTDLPLFITDNPAKYLYRLYMQENFAHSCPQFPKEYLIRLYIRFRIYKFIKETNEHLKATF